MSKLNITDDVLDKLGFGEYMDGTGDYGTRTLVFKNGQAFRIVEQDQKDDDTDGHWTGGIYLSNKWYFSGSFAIPEIKTKDSDLYFIHEMYNCINQNYPECTEEFYENCKKVKMEKYL